MIWDPMFLHCFLNKYATLSVDILVKCWCYILYIILLVNFYPDQVKCNNMIWISGL